MMLDDSHKDETRRKLRVFLLRHIVLLIYIEHVMFRLLMLHVRNFCLVFLSKH